MSVIVIGMEMPVNCANCFAISDSFGWCKVSENEIFNPFSMDGHPSFCPLRSLPEKHGRLIDADALDYSLGISDEDIDMHFRLEECETIVEAEGE